MRNIKLTIEYDGTRYCGWQIQPDNITIQEELEKAITKITKEKIKLIGSGRTDSGVHARGQVANFYTKSRVPAQKFKLAINSLLPKDIAVLESEEVEKDFHARFSAKGKEYKYLIYNNKIRSPLLRNYTYHVPYSLNVEKMKKAATHIIGTHDFKAFMSSGSSVKDTVRTIHSLSIEERPENIIEIRIKGNGFLYNMVRIITGTLIEVGTDKIPVDDISEIINSQNRSKAGHTAPPQGLYLERVFYRETS
ncbi:tRNA pseudouridine(38-40) synthase TruA [Thermohalobacter berrensis]|uniref:tRNA pseudouridine synthase A n=1 Tax=Thermohalobacter berrensis TaxID=99594 RepID=A0A419T9K7_9FIRM|nr:tRNA pseudouridine(38-40) synthase TruA [Thermohalobacter berrensis]RKD34146.1 tRNA pseudouridine(38-40) synthase TruA [Thermohalobacter berrensis]